MTLRTRFGYPIGVAAGIVGLLRQTQRWLPRYEWVAAHQLASYVAVINLLVVAVGAVGVFAIGVRADRELAHRWRLSPAVQTALSSAIIGLAVGTTLTVLLQPGHNTITISLGSYLVPMAVYIVSHGLPIGLAAIAGLAASRIHAIESTTNAVADEASANTAETATDNEADSSQPAAASGSRFPER